MGIEPRYNQVRIGVMDAPDLYTYLDYRQFLRDWFDWKKGKNPRYSHRLFARRAQIGSPSLLLLVSEGKRNLTPQTTASFAAAMDLDDDAARFFTLLVRMDQAATETEGAEALEEILATKRFREARRLDAAALACIARWWFPAIHELAKRADFRADPAWVAARIAPQIPVEDAAEALDSLLALGLLAPDADGVPRPTDESVVTPHEVTDMALNRYHAGMLQRAGEAIARFGPDDRHLLGVTVAIPRSLVPEVKARLNEIQRELLQLCEVAPHEQVYQLSIAFFPLSDDGGSP